MSRIKLVCALIFIVLVGTSNVHGDAQQDNDLAWHKFAMKEITTLRQYEAYATPYDEYQTPDIFAQNIDKLSNEAASAFEYSKSQSVSRKYYDAKTNLENGLVELMSLNGILTSKVHSDPGPDIHLVMSEANKFLDSALRDMPVGQATDTPTDILSAKADKLFMQGKTEEALSCCNEALNLSPDEYGLWAMKGQFLDALGRYDEAIVAYTKTLELAPLPVKAQMLHAKGNDYYALHRYEDAIKCFDEAIPLVDSATNIKYEIWCDKGVSLGHLGKYDEAISYYNKVIVLAPSVGATSSISRAWYLKGRLLSNNENNYAEAIACFDNAINLTPEYSYAIEGKSDALKALGKTSESEAVFKKAEEIDNTTAYYQTLQADYQTMQNETANGDVERVNGMVSLLNDLNGGSLAPITAEIGKDGIILLTSPGTPSVDDALKNILFVYGTNYDLGNFHGKGDLYIHIKNGGDYICKRAEMIGETEAQTLQRVKATLVQDSDFAAKSEALNKAKLEQANDTFNYYKSLQADPQTLQTEKANGDVKRVNEMMSMMTETDGGRLEPITAYIGKDGIILLISTGTLSADDQLWDILSIYESSFNYALRGFQGKEDLYIYIKSNGGNYCIVNIIMS